MVLEKKGTLDAFLLKIGCYVMLPKQTITHNAEETAQLGRVIARQLEPGSIVSLEGVLGSGKTTMVKGMATELNISETVTSPSFTIMTVYQGDITLNHIDLYRIETDEEILSLGIEEILYGDGISVIEWGDRASKILPDRCLHVRFELLPGLERKIELEQKGLI